MHKRLTLLAIAVTGAFATAPAHAAGCAPGSADKPDLGFVDSNCDGVDGDKAHAIFVAPGGDDNADGSFGSPMKSVGAAVTKALAAHKDVYVAAGTYDGKVSFLNSTGGLGVYGGYDAQTWQRSAANVTTLQAPGQVVGVAVPHVTLQLLTVRGLPGFVTSYGVRSFNSDASVALSRVSIQTTDGLGGVDGADATQTPPAKADDGDQGVANPACDDANGPWALGGQGGLGVLDGGSGGSAAYGYPWAGFPGQNDPANPSVVGGGGGQSPYIDGKPGSPGKPGLYGLPGQGDVNSQALFYQALAGGTAHEGTPGAGGGGGAASSYLCVPGSGGGAGGVGGAGGAGGKGGGGSIGVFAGTGSHVLVLDGSVIHTASGGHGGAGGYGQPGGEGGDGGPAGVDIFVHKYPSGAGGKGGAGGPGGRGGGGAGGASIGVLAVDSRAVVSQDTTIVPGIGGKGGLGGYTGWAGRSEKSEQVASAKGAIPTVADFDGDGIADDADGCPIAAGPNNGCPVDAPSGPVAGDPTATAPDGGGALPGVSASCVDKRVYRVHLRRPRVRTARATLDGHRLKLVKGKRRWTAKVDLRHSKRTTHTLTIRGKLRSGKRFKQTRHYRTCATP